MTKIILVDGKGEELAITENDLVVLRQMFMNQNNIVFKGRKLGISFYESVRKDENGNPYKRIET